MSTIITTTTSKHNEEHIDHPSSLHLAAKAGMFVKLHVNNGCNIAEGIDIPIKNLLIVNSNKEALSDQASYSILRHCALSELFKYAPNRQIPSYAQHFETEFTYFPAAPPTSPKSAVAVPQLIENSDELTKVLEEVSLHQLMDDNQNIIMHIHCEFTNNFHIKEAERIRQVRKEATLAADHVVTTLKIWIQKASNFVSTHAAMFDQDNDFVHVPDEKKKDKKKDVGPLEWTSRFVQVLLVPEHQRRRQPMKVKTSPSSSWNQHDKKQVKKIHHGCYDDQGDDLLAHYEESIEALTISVIKGLKNVSNFINKAIEDHHQQQQKMAGKKNKMVDDELSISPTPSLAGSVSLSSSSDNEEDSVVEEQGVEIMLSPSSTSISSVVVEEQKSEEWKIFFGEPEKFVDDAEEAVMISNPCDEDVISMSSSSSSSASFSLCESDAELSFEDVTKVEEVEQQNYFDMDEDWATFSDDE